jgi:hypothetical protein
MRWLALTAGLLMALLPTTLGAQTKLKACEGKTGQTTKMLYDYRQNIDLRAYTPVPGVGQVPMTATGQDASLHQKAREDAFQSAFSLVSRLGLSYQKAMPVYLEGYDDLRTRNDSSILQQEIKIYREWETRDYDECIYKYEVELAVPKFPRLGSGLDELVRKVLENSIPRKTDPKGSVPINLAQLIDNLLKDPAFRSRLEALSRDENFQSDLQYKDDDTQLFFRMFSGQKVEATGYPKGQFRVNSLIGTIITRSVVPTVQFYLARYKTVIVSCDGYTDRLPINPGGIFYNGNANLTTAGSPAQFHPAPLQIGPERRLRSNIDLSVARAYEGISALASGLQTQASRQGLTLLYSGNGEVNSAQRDNPASRKIIFHITYQDRQR